MERKTGWQQDMSVCWLSEPCDRMSQRMRTVSIMEQKAAVGAGEDTTDERGTAKGR